MRKIHSVLSFQSFERHDHFRTSTVREESGRERELVVKTDRPVKSALGIMREQLAPRTMQGGDVVVVAVLRGREIIAHVLETIGGDVEACGRFDVVFQTEERGKERQTRGDERGQHEKKLLHFCLVMVYIFGGDLLTRFLFRVMKRRSRAQLLRIADLLAQNEVFEPQASP